MTSPTVLLDSNVWRYLADHSSVSAVDRCARRSGVTIQVAPSVVYEALRTGDPELRRRLIAFMVHGSWERLMPEAYEECQEILGEVRRLRPEWLWRVPDYALLHRYRLDWARPSGGVWDRLRYSLDREAAILSAMDRGEIERAHLQAKAMRAQVREAALEKGMLELGKLTAMPAGPLAGWKGVPVAPWRLDGLAHLTSVLRSAPDDGHPYHEWLSPVMDTRACHTGASWNAFWLHEVDVVRMPRHWFAGHSTPRRLPGRCPVEHPATSSWQPTS